MEPLQESTRWISSSPAVLDGDLSLPTLMIRLGSACNALIAQQMQTVQAMKGGGAAASMRNLLWSFITAGSFTKEAITILTGQKDVPPESERVKELAILGGASEDLLKTIGQLCGGSHPASPVLARVRNKMGFHWDPALVELSLQEFRRNQQLLWIEAKDGSQRSLVFRLSADVLANAILQEKPPGDTALPTTKEAFDATLGYVSDAMDAITLYFHDAISAYLEQIDAEGHQVPVNGEKAPDSH